MGDFTNSSGVDWNFNSLEDHISNRGTDVIHETGVACTCRGSDPFDQSNETSVGCDRCDGFGFVYRNARYITGLLTSISQKRTLLLAGFAAPGDCVFSPHANVSPGVSDFDRITFTHGQPVNEGQKIVRGAGSRGDNRGLKTYLEKNEDRLFYEASSAIHCEDENDIIYEEGGDFVLEGRVIKWLNDRMPVNTKYTVKYEGYLEWIVFVSPFERRDRERDLGQRVLLRKRHVAIMTGFNPKVTSESRAESAAPISFSGNLVA